MSVKTAVTFANINRAQGLIVHSSRNKKANVLSDAGSEGLGIGMQRRQVIGCLVLGLIRASERLRSGLIED